LDNWSIIKPEECLFELEYFVYRSCRDTDCQHMLIATREHSHVSIIITVDRNWCEIPCSNFNLCCCGLLLCWLMVLCFYSV